MRGGEPALSSLLALTPRPTAILAATDTMAIGLIHAACGLGVAVPDELSIVGFDDIPFASATVPELTTVRMPMAEIVAAGVELAVGAGERPSDAGEKPPNLVFTPKLIVRRSTAGPAAPAPRE